MTAGLYAGIALLVVLPLVAGLVTAGSSSLDAVSPIRAEAMADERLRGAATLVRLLDQSQQILALLRLVRLACVSGYVTVLSVIVLDRNGLGWLTLALTAYVIATYPIVETIPRGWADRGPDRVARKLAWMTLTLHRLPPLRLVSAFLERAFGRFAVKPDAAPVVSEDELIALTEEAAARDKIEEEELEMIESVFALGDTVVREVMVPRTDMVTTAVGSTISDALDIALARGLSRIPITGVDVDDIVGLSFVKDLTKAERSGQGGRMIGTLMRRARFVPETKHAHDLLREMQAGEHHMAIVVDEYGGTAGLVTLEDLVEELVGEIVDEFDSEEPIWETLIGGDVRVHGRMPVDELNDLIDADLPDGDWDTVGGLIFDNLGRVPEVGEVMESSGWRLIVEKMEGRRITRVRVASLAQDSIDTEPEQDK